MANARCSAFPEKRWAMALARNIAATAPKVKGMAIVQFIWPMNVADTTPAPETSAMTASDVPMMDSIWRSVALRKAGTMMNPPPTPSNPDRKPVDTPESASDPAQGLAYS